MKRTTLTVMILWACAAHCRIEWPIAFAQASHPSGPAKQLASVTFLRQVTDSLAS